MASRISRSILLLGLEQDHYRRNNENEYAKRQERQLNAEVLELRGDAREEQHGCEQHR